MIRPVLCGIAGILAVTALGLWILGLVAPFPAGFWVRDPLAAVGGFPLAGFVSVFSVGLWLVAATAAGLGVVVDHHDDAHRRLLRVVLIASLALWMDDQFMLHETVGPKLTGLDDLWFVLPWVVSALVVAWRHGDTALRHPDGALLLLAMAGLGSSLVVDVVNLPGQIAQVTEDLLKMGGILAWALFAMAAMLRRARAPRPDRFAEGAWTALAEAPPLHEPVGSASSPV